MPSLVGWRCLDISSDLGGSSPASTSFLCTPRGFCSLCSNFQSPLPRFVTCGSPTSGSCATVGAPHPHPRAALHELTARATSTEMPKRLQRTVVTRIICVAVFVVAVELIHVLYWVPRYGAALPACTNTFGALCEQLEIAWVRRIAATAEQCPLFYAIVVHGVTAVGCGFLCVQGFGTGIIFGSPVFSLMIVITAVDSLVVRIDAYKERLTVFRFSSVPAAISQHLKLRKAIMREARELNIVVIPACVRTVVSQ